ncbi:MAG: circularly permuted type 2 ATP-grasp protein, partial [Pseudomonadota bacterium]
PAYFSHAYMARYLDITLVEPGDLTARNGEAQVKTLEGLRPMGVALRGAPSLGIDPIYAPGPSAVAPPGVMFAAKKGVTTFANMVGAGVLDGRALAPCSTALMRRLKGQDPILDEAPALDLGDADARRAYLANPDDWRLAPKRFAARPGGAEPFDPFAGLQGEALAAKLAREGHRFVARGKVDVVSAPGFEPRAGGALWDTHYAMRLFVVKGPEGFEVMPGGLAQTSETSLIDVLPWAGDAKDVWVVEETAEREPAASTVVNARRASAHRRRTGRDLLSRMADNLFWLGRFAERSETTLRILKLVLERFIEAPKRQREPAMLADLLELHLGEDRVPPPRDEPALIRAMATLAFDPSIYYGLRSSLDGVHRNAAQTRAHLSRDGWRDVAALCTDPVWRASPDEARPLTLAQPIETGIRALTAFSGAAHENMSRNYAWRFLEMGRRIERGVQTVGMLKALVAKPREDEATALLTVLQLADCFFAYRSRYMTTPEAAAVLDLLALDEINPRSLTYQLAALERSIAELPHDGHIRSAEHKAALALLTDFRVVDAPALAEVDETGARSALIRALDSAEAGLEAVSDMLGATYFAHAEGAAHEVALARLEGAL